MKYTSSEANKLLTKLTEERNAVRAKEDRSREFLAALGEDISSVKPDYDFVDCQTQIATLNKKIRTVKHAINVFNTTTLLPNLDITVDEALVYLPQLTEHKNKLSRMCNKLPKVREAAYSGGETGAIIDYRILNYDLNDANSELNKTSDLILKIQTALDVLNNTVTMDIDV